ncbi:hypothetical protein [Flavobacterium sp. RS13.1]
MDHSKLTEEQIKKIQAKIDKAEKSGFSTKTKEELLIKIKKKLGL